MIKKALIGARIFTGDEFIEDHVLVLDDEKIDSIIPTSNLDSHIETIQLSGGILAPGLIDLQVNGGGGVLFSNDRSTSAIKKIVSAHRLSGTTSLLPTLLSDARDLHQSGVDAVKQCIAAGNKSVLGIHLEGPFFNHERRGAHHQNALRDINQDDITWLKTLAHENSGKVMVTLAPEKMEVGQIKQLSAAGLFICAGHTDATYQQITSALQEGLIGFTHLYNAMRSISAREPGVVGAALDDMNSWCGIIIDMHHVAAASARIAYAAKPKGKMYLVSDAMATVGASEKSFSLYGETITEKNGRLINAEGHLAGSAIGMIDAVRLNTEWIGVDLAESLRMASLYPAEFMRVDNYLGRIAPRYRADLVHFSEDYKVNATWVAGQEGTFA